MERDFDEYVSPDTLSHHISTMKSLCQTAEGDTASKMRARTLFWQSRFAGRYISKDSASHYAKMALQLTDSSTMRYDWLRFKTQLYASTDTVNGAERYRHYDETLKYARAIGDEHLEAHVAINMGNLMLDINQPEKANYYYDLCDSLNLRLGLLKLPVKNLINRASVLHLQGASQKGDSILLSLQGHPALEGDTFAQNLIPRNLYGRNRENVIYLHQAYSQIKENPRFRHLRGLYRGLLTEHYAETEQWDSMLMYNRLMMEDLPYVRQHNHRAIIWYNHSRIWAYLNQPDSALMARIEYEECLDSLRAYEQSNEVIRLNALEEMRKQEASYSLALTQRNWLIALIAVILIGGGTVTVLLLNRRHMRQRLKNMANELELEKAKRKMAATAITIEEKDVVLDTLRNELSELRREGEIREGSARRLEATIKTHLSEHEQEEKFREMFDLVNPGFADNLRQICPDLADSYIKLASYILMDLDNKKIATLMRIKPESVRQARWRLRQRLQIPENTSLEDYLRSLNTPKRS